MQRAKAPTAEVTIDRYYCLSWKDLEAREDDAVREMENGRFFFFFHVQIELLGNFMG